MIRHHFMAEHPQVAERLAGTATVVTGATVLGASIAQINEFLQAGAFVVAIISGLAATAYYIRKGRERE